MDAKTAPQGVTIAREFTDGLSRYILVDPASEKKKDNDYTAMVVIGLGADDNYYILDIVRDRLNRKRCLVATV